MTSHKHTTKPWLPQASNPRPYKMRSWISDLYTHPFHRMMGGEAKVRF